MLLADGRPIADGAAAEVLAGGWYFATETARVTEGAALLPADGAALVSGRLLAEITKALPAKPVDIAAVGAHLELVCGSARFTLPTMPVEDYPTLPDMPSSAGTVDAAAFASAVAQVAVAAGRDETLPMMTGTKEAVRVCGRNSRHQKLKLCIRKSP